MPGIIGYIDGDLTNMVLLEQEGDLKEAVYPSVNPGKVVVIGLSRNFAIR